MTPIGPMNSLPIACTLSDLAAAREQVAKWRAFDADYALRSETTDTKLTIHYAKVDDSTQRLRDLVATEQICCAFVEWSIDETGHDLKLIVTGTPFQLAALNVG